MFFNDKMIFLGVSPDMQPKKKYIWAPGGSEGQTENTGETQNTSESVEQTEEQLSKLMEEKMTNNGTGDNGKDI